jgi:hypothetical protein
LEAKYRDVKSVFMRSLEEISKDAIETVLELIAQKSLYKGDEWKGPLTKFLELHTEYHALPDAQKDNYCWATSVDVGGAIGKIKNHSIGVLLSDITEGVDLNEAVRKYEKIVAPSNYKRPKAIFTKDMIEKARQTLEGLGLLDSLGRRHATIDDITVNNILFANKDAARRMDGGDVFADLEKEAKAVNPRSFDKVEEIPVEVFVRDVLPTTTSIEVFVENRHTPNFMSVIAPQVKDSPSMLKWGNPFTWAYNGNIADSMKERVKAAGGNVDGVFRYSLQWNDGEYNPNDFDAHALEPDGNLIYYRNKRRIHPSSGMLDVDIVDPIRDTPAVENITWTDLRCMQEGVYTLLVHNFSHNGGRTGFEAEIEYEGQIYSFSYPHELRHKEKVTVAKLEFSRQGGIKFIESLPSSLSQREVWGLNTNQFHPVSLAMFSPNYWDEQTGIGHRHYFFILNGCKNDTSPNGFFNISARTSWSIRGSLRPSVARCVSRMPMNNCPGLASAPPSGTR